MTIQRPPWQTAECPRWCAREHLESDRDGDRDHISEPIYFPTVRLLRQRGSTDQVTRSLAAEDLLVTAFQGVDDPHPWISFGVPEDARTGLEISPESAIRLIEALHTAATSVRE